jgi:hypothetical protein
MKALFRHPRRDDARSRGADPFPRHLSGQRRIGRLTGTDLGGTNVEFLRFNTTENTVEVQDNRCSG